MKKFPPELLNKIREKINIIEIVGEHVVLRKSGSNYSGLCPFHSERSPSFSVSESKQLYHCYGCKKGGDLFSFVMEIYGVSFPDAISDLAERASVALPKEFDAGSGSDDPETQRKRAEAREKLATASKLNRFVAAFYHQGLAQFPEALQYFRTRGVNEQSQREFYVGYAPAAWDALATHLNAKKAPLPLAVELGLIRPSTKQNSRPGGSGYFDLFRNRAMFPILDMRGKVAGFGGRSLPALAEAGAEAGADGPKYINSAESLLFQKSRLAFGLYQAQKHIREKDEVIVVEGYFDVVALHAAGIQNVVATCGTSLTPEHLNQFKRLASKITLLFDGDKAGISATERAMSVGLEQGLVLYGAAMPEGLDPDELLFDQISGAPIATGVEKMREILAASHPLLDARMEEEIASSRQSAEARTQAIKKIGGWLAHFKDPVGRAVRTQVLQERLGLTQQMLDQALGQHLSKNQVGPATRGTAMPQVVPVARPLGGPQSGPRAGGGGRPPQRQPQYAPSPPVERPMPRPNSGPRANSRSNPQPKKMSQGERILLEGIAKGGRYDRILAEFSDKLPPKHGISDLFDHAPTQALVARLMLEPELLAKLRSNPSEFMAEVLGGAPESPEGGGDPILRTLLTEILVPAPEAQGASPSSQAPTSEEIEGDFRTTLDKLNARLWARFSQQIKRALADAEARKDAGLQSQLMKEYLDVQRKMKEFTSFYDEA